MVLQELSADDSYSVLSPVTIHLLLEPLAQALHCCGPWSCSSASSRQRLTTLLAAVAARMLCFINCVYTEVPEAEALPLNHVLVISSRLGRYATQQAASICLWFEGTGSTTTYGFDPFPSSTSAARPPAIVSTTSIPASARAADATVIHPLSVDIRSHSSCSLVDVGSLGWSLSMTVMMMSTPLFGHLSAIMTPRRAVSRWTLRSRSVASRTYPRRCLVANGACLTCAESTTYGENGADFGSGRGPCTVQVSFSPESFTESLSLPSSSRYADPDAEGVTPVLRTAYLPSVHLRRVRTRGVTNRVF